MPLPDDNYSTLQNIRTKVRRLTRTPSEAQLATQDIDNYINNFVLYDFPEHLRLFALKTTLTFYAMPYVSDYTTNTANPTDPLYNFRNKYVSITPPVYVAGYQCVYSQNREQFFGMYPILNNIMSIGTAGDGVTTAFNGVLSNLPVLTNAVSFVSVDSNNNGIVLEDVPVTTTTGNLVQPNYPAVILGNINYVTGVYNFIFPTAPGEGKAINSETVPYVPALPQAVLYFNDTFTLRPIPDQPYPVNLEVFARPTTLINSGDEPYLTQWWQYIAYGAAKKIFEDRMDMESVQMIMPEFRKQECLVNRTSIVQYTNERTATIYTEQSTFGPGNNGFGNGNF